MQDNADASVESLFVRKLLSELKKTNQTPYLMYHTVYSTHEKKFAVNPSRQGAKLIKSIYIYKWWHKHHKNQLKSYEWNLLFSTLCCWIYGSILITMNRARSHTVNVKNEKKIHLDMTDWDQNGHSTAFKKSLNAVGNSVWRTTEHRDNGGPEHPTWRKRKKSTNKIIKKTLDGQHKCYEIYEKSYFLYFIKKRKSKSPTQNKTFIRPHWIRTY